jgi:hypothetical protein
MDLDTEQPQNVRRRSGHELGTTTGPAIVWAGFKHRIFEK